MTIHRERFDGPIVFECDGSRCNELEETRCSDFHSALAKVKSHGWVVRKRGEEWLHFCPDCK